MPNTEILSSSKRKMPKKRSNKRHCHSGQRLSLIHIHHYVHKCAHRALPFFPLISLWPFFLLLASAKWRFGSILCPPKRGPTVRVWTTTSLLRGPIGWGCIYHSVHIKELHAEDAQLLSLVQLGGTRELVGLANIFAPLLAQLQDRFVGDGTRELIHVERLKAETAALSFLQTLVHTGLKGLGGEGFVFLPR